MKKKTDKKDVYPFVFTKKELRAVIKALRYDLDENGYSYVKDNLELDLRVLIGDVKFTKDSIIIK